VWFHSQADSRTQNGGQSPRSDVVNTWHCGNQGHDPDPGKSHLFIMEKRHAAFVTTVIPFDIQMTHLTGMKLSL